ncbi:MAG: hypothetical protein KatS3mg064_1574 [Tepidiforma sp.]|nr:MAG: hypothetical protein KatS3mg064_1574 [Tepidiforma sp.]
MQWFTNLKVQAKLLLAFGVVLALNAAVAVMGVLELQKAADRSAAMYRENVLGVQYALLTNYNMAASGREEKRAFLQPDVTKRAPLIEQGRKELAAAEQAMADYHQTFASTADAQQWAEVEEMVKPVIADRRKIFDLLEAGKDSEAAQVAAGMNDRIAAMNAALEESGRFNAAIASDSKDAAASAASRARALLIGLTVGAVLAGLGLATWLARSMARTAREVRDAARSIARGQRERRGFGPVEGRARRGRGGLRRDDRLPEGDGGRGGGGGERRPDGAGAAARP